MSGLKPEIRKLKLPIDDNTASSEPVTVVVVPLPKSTVAVIFGQRPGAEWLQRVNTYLLTSDGFVENPQAIWDAPKKDSRFLISQIQPTGLDKDPNVLSVGPFDDDRFVAVYCSHKRTGDAKYTASDPHFSTHEFNIGSKNAITFTMVNAEDGGDSDYHDAVVGVAVNYLKK